MADRVEARDRPDIDVAGDMTRLTLDTIGLCAFSYRFNSFYSERPQSEQFGALKSGWLVQEFHWYQSLLQGFLVSPLLEVTGVSWHQPSN